MWPASLTAPGFGDLAPRRRSALVTLGRRSWSLIARGIRRSGRFCSSGRPDRRPCRSGCSVCLPQFGVSPLPAGFDHESPVSPSGGLHLRAASAGVQCRPDGDRAGAASSTGWACARRCPAVVTRSAPRVLPRHRASAPRQVLAGMWCSTMSARDNGLSRVIPDSRCGDRDLVEGMPSGSGSGDVVVRVLDRVRLTAIGRPH